MAEFPKLPLWTDAYLGDTTHLTTIEHGAYLLLLIAMWRSKGTKLPNDDRMLARYAKLTAGQWARIKPVLMPFFAVDGDSITQSRLTAEADAVRRYSNNQSDKAKTKWRKNKAATDAEAVPEPMPQNASQSQSQSYVLDTDVSNTDARDGDEFERVWSAYPRKVGKGAAKKAWAKARKREAFETIAEPLRQFIRMSRGTEPRFIPHLATWLNEERWGDAPGDGMNRARSSAEDVEHLATISSAEDTRRLFDGLTFTPALRIVG